MHLRLTEFSQKDSLCHRSFFKLVLSVLKVTKVAADEPKHPSIFPRQLPTSTYFHIFWEKEAAMACLFKVLLFPSAIVE